MESTNYIDFEKFPYLLGYLHADHELGENAGGDSHVLAAAVCDPNSSYERAVILREEHCAPMGIYYRVIVENARAMYDWDFDTEEEARACCVRMGVDEPMAYKLGFGFNDAETWEVLPNDPFFDTTEYEHLFA